MHRVGEAVRLNERPRIEACADLAKRLVRELQHSDEYVRWALQGHTEDYLVDNALHVAVLSVKVGIGLRYSDEELERLGLAGLLHDIGMWTLPSALIEKTGTLTEEELVAIRAHPERGRRILADLGSSGEWLSTISAQEHERWDGSGYPCRLKGTQITEQAQVIGVADVFDALITARPYRKRIAPHQALRELMVHAKTTFSHRVLKSLGDQVTLYPVGTAVRLNTGEIGTVSKVNPRYPLRPILAMPGDGSSGMSPAMNELDLAQATSMHIVEVLQAATVS
jgi:HD-GYP domain-containing protein (c-di-GMP phosphodiesterase class II)